MHVATNGAVLFIGLLLTCVVCNFYINIFTLPAVRGLARRRQVVRPHRAADSRGSRMNIWGGGGIKFLRSTDFKLWGNIKGSVKKNSS